MTTRITLSRMTSAPPTQAGSEMRGIRWRLGKTQREFARLLGTSRDTLSVWERGKYEPPFMALTLARYLMLATPLRSGFLLDPPDDTPAVYVRPGCQCYWQHNDALPCGGRQYHAQAQLSRRRHLETEVCEAHLHTAFAEVFNRLAAAAIAEQQRLAGRRRKRVQRQRAREAAAHAASAAPQP